MRKMKIIVDPRMELLTALQVVAGDPNIDRRDTKYYRDMISWFTPYQDHYALSHYKSINEYFSFDAPINSMLYMEFGDELKLVNEPSEYLCLRTGSKKNWMDFYTSLREFALETGFKEFFKQHEGYYRHAIEKVEAINGNCDPATELESFIGLHADQYTFRFSPLQTCGYAGCKIPQIEEVSCTIGFDPDEENSRAEICLRVYLWHEFAHVYVNPIIDDYMVQKTVAWHAFEKFISSLQTDEEKHLFENVYECVVRSITYMLIVKYYGTQEAEGILKWDEEQGFMYIRHFIHALDKYAIARAKTGVNINEYFPILLGDVITE